MSERRLGDALVGRPRDDYVVSTKVGRLLEPTGGNPGRRDEGGFDVPATHRRVWDFSRDGVLRSLDQSLERLGLDRVDLVYLHDPDDHWDDALRHAYPALEELRAQGVVSGIGAGMNQTAMLAEFARRTEMDTLMLAGRFTLVDQGALDELLPVCEDRGVGVVAAGVFNSGLLAQPQPSPGSRYDYADAPPELVERARRIADICADQGTSLPAAAINFVLSHPAVVSACVGARSAAQVARNVRLYAEGVPPGLWPALRAGGLLR